MARQRGPGRPEGSGQGKAKYLTITDIRKTEIALEGTRDEQRDLTLLHLGLGTGMRVGEMATLKVADVWDFRINEPFRFITLKWQNTKQKRSRSIIVGRIALRAITRWVEHCQEAHKYDELRNCSNPEQWLFPAKKDGNKSMSNSYLCQVFSRMFDKAGIVGAKSHSARRTHLTNLRRAGATVEFLMQQSGNKKVQNVLPYIEDDPEENQRIVSLLPY